MALLLWPCYSGTPAAPDPLSNACLYQASWLGPKGQNEKQTWNEHGNELHFCDEMTKLGKVTVKY